MGSHGVSHVKQWAGSVVGNKRLPTSYLKSECRCNELVMAVRAWTAPLKQQPRTILRPQAIQGACIGQPAWRRCVPRVVTPEPEPNWPKVCVITSIDNYCKSTALRALHAQNIRTQRRPSLLRLPIVAEAAPRLQKPPRLSAGAARGSWPARQRINKCPNLIQMKRSPTA